MSCQCGYQCGKTCRSHLLSEVATLPDVARGLIVGALLDVRASLLWIARHV